VLCSLTSKRFDGFGVCQFRPRARRRGAEVVLPAELATKRKRIREHCQTVPGVYGMIDAQGELIYVGKSKSLADRLVSYCTESEPASKARRILDRTARLRWEIWPDEFAALLRELELIRRWRPRFNVLGQPGRLRRTYVCLGRGPAGHAYLAAEPSPRAEWFFGPLPGIRRWRETVRYVNDCFLLRDCPDRVPIVFRDQLQLFRHERSPGCMRYELGICLGPCASRCSSREYRDQLQQAARFLGGADLSILDELEPAMQTAAAGRQFERAAALRDAWTGLSALHEQLQSLRDAQAHFSFVYPLPSHDGRATWYFLRHGRVVAAASAPRDRRTADHCRRLLQQVYWPTRPDDALPGAEDLDFLLLVTAWFRHHPDQLATTLTPHAAWRRCGGEWRVESEG
jgi:excinuclease ABC subunit C